MSTIPASIVREIGELSIRNGGLESFCSFSPAIYDSAWMSMIYRNTDKCGDLVFPECYDHLLRTQLDDGTWSAYTSSIDGILNTLAALLSLLTGRASLPEDSQEYIALSWRIDKAISGLRLLLSSWNVEKTVHVGFELLVPSLLRQLEAFDVHFVFPRQQALEASRSKKAQRFKPQLVYSKKQSTLIHSLEAFVGLISFDNVEHHCTVATGMMCSPASTAAYLIHSSRWDDRAESYLRTVMKAFGNSGAAPSAFPTCVFEISWALSSIWSYCHSPDDLDDDKRAAIASFLEKTIQAQGGVVGFAPGVLCDADDSARAILTLHTMGRDIDLGPMIDRFEADTMFRTYELEQNGSFSANCNVLLTLLQSKHIQKYQAQIEKIVSFLLNQWAGGVPSDKWNVSSHYSIMLSSQVFVQIIEAHQCGHLPSLGNGIVTQRIPLILFTVASKMLLDQQESGSWSESLEMTAYAMIALSQCLKLPWSLDITSRLKESLERGRVYLEGELPRSDQLEHLWVEKVSYCSSLLRDTYCAIALDLSQNTPSATLSWSKHVRDTFDPAVPAGKIFEGLLTKVPLIQSRPQVSIQLALLEGSVLSERLQKSRNSIFPRDSMPLSEDKYLTMIPIIWAICNQINGHALSADVSWAMIELSLFNYQADEYMETVVSQLGVPGLKLLTSKLAKWCGVSPESTAPPPSLTSNSERCQSCASCDDFLVVASTASKSGASLESITRPLQRYISHVLGHPSVIESPPLVQNNLQIELYNFLVAHMVHNRDNKHLKMHQGLPKLESTQNDQSALYHKSYFNWVRSVGSDDTSCPFSLQFFACLISAPRRSCFEGAQPRYYSNSLARHLATMCRQYNDFGSAVRDRDENNLNSLDFTDFTGGKANEVANRCQPMSDSNGAIAHERGYPTDAMKKELMEIAEYERSCMQIALRSLVRITREPSVIEALQVFIDVTDLFGQIYVEKDIASRVQMRDGSV